MLDNYQHFHTYHAHNTKWASIKLWPCLCQNYVCTQTTAEFEKEISQNTDYGFNTAAYHAYDSVWTLAYGINRYWNSNCIYNVAALVMYLRLLDLYTYPCFVFCRSLPVLESGNEVIANFTYRDNGRRITDIINDQFINSDFTFIGVSVSELCAI